MGDNKETVENRKNYIDALAGIEWYSLNDRGMTIQDYASKNHISYEAVRRQVAQYKDILQPHIIKKGRTQYLDDFAVDFLEKHRRIQVPANDYNLAWDQIKQYLQDIVENTQSSDSQELSDMEQQLDTLKNEKCTLEKQLQDTTEQLKDTEIQLKKTEAQLKEVENHRQILQLKYDELSKRFKQESSSLNQQIAFIKERLEFAENLSRILAAKDYHEPEDKFGV